MSPIADPEVVSSILVEFDNEILSMAILLLEGLLSVTSHDYSC